MDLAGRAQAITSGEAIDVSEATTGKGGPIPREALDLVDWNSAYLDVSHTISGDDGPLFIVGFGLLGKVSHPNWIRDADETHSARVKNRMRAELRIKQTVQSRCEIRWPAFIKQIPQADTASLACKMVSKRRASKTCGTVTA